MGKDWEAKNPRVQGRIKLPPPRPPINKSWSSPHSQVLKIHLNSSESLPLKVHVVLRT